MTVEGGGDGSRSSRALSVGSPPTAIRPRLPAARRTSDAMGESKQSRIPGGPKAILIFLVSLSAYVTQSELAQVGALPDALSSLSPCTDLGLAALLPPFVLQYVQATRRSYSLSRSTAEDCRLG